MIEKGNATRRAVLAGAAMTVATSKLGLGQAQAGAHASSSLATPAFETEIDFMSPTWNRDAWARIQADLNPNKESFVYCTGQVFGVKPGEKVVEICSFETFLATRLVPQEDGTIRRLNKEVIFYTDSRTGEIIQTYDNPWTGETVNVVQVANDPFNYTISEWLILAPEDFKSSEKAEPKKIPLIFPWKKLGEKKLLLTTDMHLYYPNPLDPEKWKRESAGPMVQVSELFRHIVPVDELTNPELTSVHVEGSWQRITPWLPWMLMGQTPGHCLYAGTMIKSDTLDIVPANIIKYAEDNYPGITSAPTEDYGPSHSSLEYYAREQTPAPVIDM